MLAEELFQTGDNDILLGSFSLPVSVSGRIGGINGGGMKVFVRLNAWGDRHFSPRTSDVRDPEDSNA